MANTVTNVTTGKPSINGAIWRAPYGTALPTSVTDTLAAAFNCLGYCSDDGLTNGNAPSSETIKAWGGDTVLEPTTGRVDTFAWKAIEAMNVDVLKMVYGDSNVSGDLDSGITVRANSEELAAAVYVIDTVMKGGVLKRTVIPNGKMTNLEDIVYKDNQAVGYGVTISAMSGGFGAGDSDTHKEYIKKPATT